MESQLSSNIRGNIQRIQQEIAEAAISANRNPEDVMLMAVTKTRTVFEVNSAIDAGICLLGENKAQELVQRYDGYRKDNVKVHFIGHLQTNKVRQIVDKVDMIHSVESLRLMEEIQHQSALINKRMDILIEVNVGGEDSKQGVAPEEAVTLAEEVTRFPNLRLRGLMTIPPRCGMVDCEKYFYRMQNLFVDIQEKKIDNVLIDILSMGMSGDFPMAIRYGATVVRVGTAIFGQRD